MVRTKKGALRRYRAIYRSLGSGFPYGWDWPTLRGTDPVKCLKLQILLRLVEVLL